MNKLILTLLLVSANLCLMAQCESNNSSFELWSEQTISLDDSNPSSQFLVDLPDDHVSVLRFFFYSLGVLFGEPEALGDYMSDPQAALGISLSDDANTGDSAVKLQATSYANFSDLYSVWSCTELPDSIAFSVKHSGNSLDTLFVLSVFDEGLSELPQDFSAISSLSAFATTEITFDSDTDYEKITLPVIENFEAPIDTAYYLFILTTRQSDLDAGNEGFVLLDDFMTISDNSVVDNDMDGFDSSVDCDDNNPDVNPSVSEIPYNGIDDDCDALTLDDDLDQDGFVLAEDCDDTNGDVNPDAVEVAYNGIDDDCDAMTLDDDLDQDGFVLAEDCDDTNGDVNPDAVEIPNNGIDEDCDGEDLTSGIHDLATSTINIYPNPASDFINIDVEGNLNFTASIFNLAGKLIKKENNSKQLETSLIANGIYLLEIKDNATGQTILERIVIN